MRDDSTIRHSPRDRALKVILACYDGHRFCHRVLDELDTASPLAPADARLAAELAIGVARHRITAEHLASRFYKGRWAGLITPIRMILALAVYQICWLDRVPAHAAVDEAVRQAKRRGRGRTGLVNAVLRKLAASCGEVIDRPRQPDPQRYLPLGDERGRLFDQDVFPDPLKRPLDYWGAATGYPPWLVERWHRRFKPALCRQVCEAGARRPPLVLRPNTIRTTASELLASLQSDGHDASRVEGSDAILLRGSVGAAEVWQIDAGLCQPQDSTSQMAMTLSPPKAGDVVIDLCAGAGTKSTQAAELMKNDGIVLASDTDRAKLDKLPETAERLGLSIIQATRPEDLAATLQGLGRAADVILVDVPCTNTGVLARRPDARYRATHKALAALVDIQHDILGRARSLAGVGTRMIYTTCSLEREENEDQVSRFCTECPDWRVERQVFTMPDSRRDGGFAALLTQRSHSER